MKCKCYLLLLVFFFCFTVDAYCWGNTKSRGGGVFHSSSSRSSNYSRSSRPSTSRWNSIQSNYSKRTYTTGSKSSSTNIHQKHERAVGLSGQKYESRSEALSAFQKTSEFSSLPTHFAKEPEGRPEYIPPQVSQKGVSHPVVFSGNQYGYYSNSGQFTPLTLQDYFIPERMLFRHGYSYHPGPYRSSSTTTTQSDPASPASLWVGMIGLLMIAGFVIAIVYLIAQAFNTPKSYARPLVDLERPQKGTYVPRSLDPTLNLGSDSSREIWHAENQWLAKLYSLSKGKIVTLSDPLTLTDFGHPADFTVAQIQQYEHPTFRMFHAVLTNDARVDILELHLFAKEVGGDYALFLGILDHEGTAKTLLKESWHHLKENGDSLADSFVAIIPIHEQDQEIVFTQYEFGAFYDVKSSEVKKPISLCEYYPIDAPMGLDWQHSIVTWQEDWLRCYYCVEIHEKNVDLLV